MLIQRNKFNRLLQKTSINITDATQPKFFLYFEHYASVSDLDFIRKYNITVKSEFDNIAKHEKEPYPNIDRKSVV